MDQSARQSAISNASRRKRIADVVRVSSGNFLEMYDFIIYGYYAQYIADTFFPEKSQFVRLMLSLVTFGAGYLMRPLGAIVLGAYIDRKGRRLGLIVTLSLMALGTLSIAVTPSYAMIGIAAPLIVVAGRLVQGFSAGVEIGGASIYLAEIATPGHRGFYCAWQSGSQQVAVIFSALLGVALTYYLPPEQMTLWGWRVPLLVGCLVIPVIYWLRTHLSETEDFLRQKPVGDIHEVMRLLAEHWRAVTLGVMLSVLTTVTFYLITAYTPTFASRALHLNATGNLVVTLLIGMSNLFWLPVGGAISDRIGRYPLLYVIPLLILFTSYPAMLWLAAAPSFSKLLLVELWFSFFFGMYNGAMIPRLAEMMPKKVRATAFALAFSTAAGIFGGFTPAVGTYLIEITGNRAAPALWLSAAAAISLIAVLLSRPVQGEAFLQEAGAGVRA